ncbi:phosphate acyltransferase [Tropicibacter naphthalenivorans]|uniref:Phosphate acetyltransferase n=1 Tax=Tropicibacter naphthalenivorans TaxID=441103 RepID=A0A0P1GWS5_9RHOB|nr:phosphate acyltransferase [Tropicibacter naphthalenivorans]CUH79381.1 Phosphate acetyltransferase [Tropicibacter naphthalenivorans]SMC71796.1 phosphate acetyltransferase [Tropicibacter naphthalenivorans]
MAVLEQAIEAARARGARVVFPEMEDARVTEACARLSAEGLCTPVPLGDVSEAQIAALVEGRGVKEGVARRMLARPLYRAAAMVAAGEADCMVAGADSPTKRVIEAASIGIGLADGVTVPSSFFLMVFPGGREMIWADCAVNVAPDAAALASIARASEASAKALLRSTKVALLSFSTGKSGAGDSVDVVRAAAEATGFLGPIQADAALNARIAGKKGMGDGNANVLVFPSLDAGNIAYKLAQELAGAQALGPILQGFRRPVCDLSRGATVEDIVAATAVTVALSQVGQIFS